jgi:hypothetical protein
VLEKVSAERVTVDDQYLNLCPYHVRAHKKRFKKRPPHGVKLFFVSVPDAREPLVWLVRETSELRARKAVVRDAQKHGVQSEVIIGKSTRVSVANPDNIQTGVLMIGRLA